MTDFKLLLAEYLQHYNLGLMVNDKNNQSSAARLLALKQWNIVEI